MSKQARAIALLVLENAELKAEGAALSTRAHPDYVADLEGRLEVALARVAELEAVPGKSEIVRLADALMGIEGVTGYWLSSCGYTLTLEANTNMFRFADELAAVVARYDALSGLTWIWDMKRQVIRGFVSTEGEPAGVYIRPDDVVRDGSCCG